MTRKDFELIARVIRATANSAPEQARWAWAFAKELETTNPEFDRRRFFGAATKTGADNLKG